MSRKVGEIPRREAWPIRVSRATRDRYKKAADAISRRGWLAAGSDRTDKVSLGTVAEQALVLLEKQLENHKPGR